MRTVTFIRLASIALILVWIAAIVGWFSNLIWLFAVDSTGPEFWIALIGLVAVPVGVIHGLMVLF